MAKVRREEVVVAALELLDEVGLERLSTRRLAERLGVESPTLYWHFRDKQALLSEMAAAVVAKHHNAAIPDETERWPEWFAENARAFRKTLLSVRDGARLHAGSRPDADEMARIVPKLDYLVKCGFPRHEALMAIMTAGQFTLGSVMEEQSRPHDDSTQVDERPLALKALEDLAEAIYHANPGGDAAFEYGLNLIIKGLADRPHHKGAVGPDAGRVRVGRRKPLQNK